MYDTVLIEDCRKPSVALVSEGFSADARSAARSRGMPGLRVVVEPVPRECTMREKTEAGISAVMDDIIGALTQPLTAEESALPIATETTARTVFRGSLQHVNRLFYRNGWTDGLPIVPPTEEAVSEMLSGTDLPADHVVVRMIPRLGKATVEKIAINAVMAGALPTYMPVLVAGVQALLEPRTGFGTYEVSTGSWSPFWVVNGSIRKDLHLNCGIGVLSPGNMANTTIGHAMALIIKTIGGVRPGVEDMGSLGNPGKFAMVVAENEEESPWEPLHVQQGLSKADSAISVYFPNCYSQVWSYGIDDYGILRTLVSNILPGRSGLCSILIPPAHAHTLADKGWTKQRIADFISEYARVPASHHPGYYKARANSFLNLADEHIRCLNYNDSLPILDDPDWIRIVVTGGPGNFLGIAQGPYYAQNSVEGQTWVTKSVALPANWDSLVRRYADLVPQYAEY
ncbi:MAG: hypothetical protein HYX90_07120 [Chloroflexi bacterium]|nr:hypothetical protein [Chloroflexota bacterium]